MRKLFTILVYTFIVLLIGRNLTSLPRFTVLTNPSNDHKVLREQTENIIKDKKGNYGIYYADLKTGQKFGINEDEMFTAASLNKVHIIAVLYYLENKGKIDFDRQITLQKEDIQDYGTGSLRYEKPGTTYTIKTLAKLSLKQSDNTAAYILANEIGRDTIQQTINEWGMTQTNIEENLTSPYDLYLLFNKIHKHEVTNEGKTKELLSFMTETDIEDRIPARLPEGAVASHKTGDAVGSLHDAGIITNGDQVFFLAVLTSDIGSNETVTKETTAEIARNITDFFDKRR